MKMGEILFFCFICLNISIITGKTSQIPVAPDLGESILKKIVSQTKNNEILKRKFLSYKRTYARYDLDENGQTMDRKRKEITSIALGGNEEIIEINDKPTKKGKSGSPRFNLMSLLETMLKLDDFTIVKIDKIDDEYFYVISFKPKTTIKPSGDIEDIVACVEGTIYVDFEKFYIKKLSAWMVKPYSRGGIFGWNIFNLTKADIELTQEELNGIIVIKSIELIDKYSLFGRETSEKQTYLYEEYRQAEPN